MIRIMTKVDVLRAAEIHVFGQRKAYRGILTDRKLFAETSVVGRADEFLSRFDDVGRLGFVYEADGVISGFLIVKPSPDADKPDAMELERIFVEPLMQGEGVGAILLDYCHKVAKEQGYNEICLWVLEGNALSRHFYEKHGYVLDSAKDRYMDTDVVHVRYVKEVIM